MRAEVTFFNDSGTVTAKHAMRVLKHGCFQYQHHGIAVGQRYAFQLNGRAPRPDPASAWQPDGVHKPSAVWRAGDWKWADQDWRGIRLQELVIYELHVGTFTAEGTFSAVIPRLDELRKLGITAIELMPVAQFPGTRGWGYDGVYWFAVQHSYGGPTELQRFVDACHACGLAVILDVIYNHFGPEGNYSGEYGPFLTNRHATPWGDGINFDGPASRPVRDFVLENVRQWIRDFHLDGLRLDSIGFIRDDSPTHILAEIKKTATEEAVRARRIVHIIAESNLNDVRILEPPASGGYGLDAQWNDDFHHCIHGLLTGERDGYYADFSVPGKQLVKALTDVFVHDGCFSIFRGREHGAPVGEHTGDRFIISIQTHDQIGNRPQGDRFGTLLAPPKQRLAAGLMLLAPHIPMLFMGEEYGETHPFPFFCDFSDEHLRDAVRRGRKKEFESFAWKGELPDPISSQTFESAVLTWDWSASASQRQLRHLYQQLLALRNAYPALKDFRHRTAELLPDPEEGKVLKLVRGDPQTPQHLLVVLFNFGETVVPLKLLIGNVSDVIFSSEHLRLTGSIHGPQVISQVISELKPFEFAVFGNASSNTPES
jgi:maltooligosyltrehalose trehalohydrolase